MAFDANPKHPASDPHRGTGRTLAMLKRIPQDRNVVVVVFRYGEIEGIKRLIREHLNDGLLRNIQFVVFDQSYAIENIRGRRKNEIFVDHNVTSAYGKTEREQLSVFQFMEHVNLLRE